jgi:RND family efflux transporter MFP subunit
MNGFLRARAIVRLALGCGALALLGGCEQENTYVAPPPPQVTVALPVQQPVTRYLETTGNASAVNTVNLVARVQGVVREINYRDGDEVKQGTVLFVIEPDTYQLRLEQARAAEAAAEASLQQAESEFQRQTELAARQVASKAALDNATANRKSAQARLQQAQVDTKVAAINNDYTRVVAPFDGIVTARQVSVGELVGGSTPTVLATIVQLDPIHVDFSISEREVLRIKAEMEKRGVRPGDYKGKVPVEAGLQNEQGYPHRGLLDYAAPSVSQSTGTLSARGIFDNPARALLPGYFARVRIPLQRDEGPSLLVPDVALGSDQGGRYVLTVNADNVVEQKPVEVGPVVGELRVIENGLKPDDRVVVAGILRALPGAKVEPQLRPLTAAAAAK